MTFQEAREFKKKHMRLIGTKAKGFPGIDGEVAELRIIGNGSDYSVHIFAYTNWEEINLVQDLLESYLERSSL